MDIPFIFVSLILVGSVFIPYGLFIRAGKKGVRKIQAKIKEVVASNNLNITVSESWRNKYIGIDNTKKVVIFLKIIESKHEIQLLDLNRIKVSEAIEKRKVIKVKNRKEVILEKLDLRVTLIDSEILLLNFYDNQQDYSEDFELLRIEKWKGILSLTTVNRPVKKVA